MVKCQFFSTCVNWNWDVDELGGLCQMVDESLQVTRHTFLSHLDRQGRTWLARFEWEYYGGFGLTMAKDWHVRYYRSKLYGQWVYYFDHSSIEHVFVQLGFRRRLP